MPRSLLCFCILGLSLLLGGCYSFTATSLPPHIKTIVIPDVENLTTDPNLAQKLRDGVIEMFRRNASGVRIVNEDGDATFQITLSGYSNTPENFSSNANVETYKATLTVNVLFQDNVKNVPIYEGRGLRADGIYDVSKNEGEERQGQTRAIEKLQELIISNALAKW